ncbi:hypothetical protein BDZ97DRAFT_563714 [Flammula alnicola]|nr:hypothetical protein BDZ97DRAFT_563714 [Flammula alnicola]
MRVAVSDSEFDSDRDPPLSIFRQSPKSRKASGQKNTKKTLGPEAIPTRNSRKVVHLGAIELTTDSESGAPPKPPRKRPKSTLKTLHTDEVIDLCSDEDESNGTCSKTTALTRMDDEVVIVSSDEEHAFSMPSNPGQRTNKQDSIVSLRKLPTSSPEKHHDAEPLPAPPDLEPQAVTGHEESFRTSLEPISAFPSAFGSNEQPIHDIIEEIPNLDDHEKPESQTDLPPASLQTLYNEAMERWRNKSSEARSRLFASALGTTKYTPPARDIVFSENLPTMDLHTPLFFSRAISALKASLIVASKRAKKRKAQALRVIPPEINHDVLSDAPAQLLIMAIASPVDAAPSSRVIPNDDLNSNSVIPLGLEMRAETHIDTARDTPGPQPHLELVKVSVDEAASTRSLSPTGTSPGPSVSATVPENMPGQLASDASVGLSLTDNAIMNEVALKPGDLPGEIIASSHRFKDLLHGMLSKKPGMYQVFLTRLRKTHTLPTLHHLQGKARLFPP